MSKTPDLSDDDQPETPDSRDDQYCSPGYHAWQDEQLKALTVVPTLPQELQDRIFEFCDMKSLAVLCLLNKQWRTRITPLVWQEIDFVEAFGESNDEVSRKFFVLCDKLMTEQPARWSKLSTFVRKLDFGRVHGVNVVHNEFEPDCDDWPYFEPPGERIPMERNIFDIVAQFTNLNSLSIYVKNWVNNLLLCSPFELLSSVVGSNV
jgi:hypothetical protein